MNVKHKPLKVLVTGKSGSGKTSFWNRVIMGAHHVKKFVFDHENEFAQRTGFPSIAYLTEQAILENEFIVFDPHPQFSDQGGIAEAFDYFCNTVFEVSREIPGPKLFASDELQAFIDANTVPESLRQVMETGRRYELDTCFISQQPNIIHNRLRNQLTEIVTFNHVDKRPLNFFEELGIDTAPIQALPRLSWIRYNLDDLNEQPTSGKIRFDKFKTKIHVDSD